MLQVTDLLCGMTEMFENHRWEILMEEVPVILKLYYLQRRHRKIVIVSRS